MPTVRRSTVTSSDPLMLVFTGRADVKRAAVHSNLGDLLGLKLADDGLPDGEWPRDPHPLIVLTGGQVPQGMIEVVNWIWEWAGIPYTLIIDDATAQLDVGQALIEEAAHVHQVTDLDGAFVEANELIRQWAHEIRIIALGTPAPDDPVSKGLVDFGLCWGVAVEDLTEGRHPIMLLEVPAEPEKAVAEPTKVRVAGPLKDQLRLFDEEPDDAGHTQPVEGPVSWYDETGKEIVADGPTDPKRQTELANNYIRYTYGEVPAALKDQPLLFTDEVRPGPVKVTTAKPVDVPTRLSSEPQWHSDREIRYTYGEVPEQERVSEPQPFPQGLHPSVVGTQNLIKMHEAPAELLLDPNSPVVQALIRWTTSLNPTEMDALIRLLAGVIRGDA